MFQDYLKMSGKPATRSLKIAQVAVLASIFSLLSLVTDLAFAQASPHQDIESQIEASAQAYLNQKYPQTEISLILTPINPSLSLPACSRPLDIRFPYTSAQRLTARVNCATPQAWSIFATARVELWQQAVIAAQPIPKGTAISNSMLDFGRVDLSRGRSNYFSEFGQVSGQTTRRAILAQQPISAHDLQPSLMVMRGDEVILESIRAGARISVKAVALEDGLLNQQISVRNQQSNREVQATVIAQGLVRSN